MKVLRELSVIIFSVVSIASAQAQVANISGNLGAPLREKVYSGVEGSPFLFDQWINGTIIMVDNKETTNVPLKYDIHQDMLVLHKPAGSFEVFPTSVRGFFFDFVGEDGKLASYKFQNGFTIDNHPITAYFQIIHDGRNKLLVKHNKPIINEEHNTYNIIDKTSKFAYKKKYYIITDSGDTQLLKFKAKDFYELFPGQKNLIKELIKKNNLTFKNEQDVLLLLSELESQALQN